MPSFTEQKQVFSPRCCYVMNLQKGISQGLKLDSGLSTNHGICYVCLHPSWLLDYKQPRMPAAKSQKVKEEGTNFPPTYVLFLNFLSS